MSKKQITPGVPRVYSKTLDNTDISYQEYISNNLALAEQLMLNLRGEAFHG